MNIIVETDFGVVGGGDHFFLPGEYIVIAVAAIGGGAFDWLDGGCLAGVEIAEGGCFAVADSSAGGAAEGPFGEVRGEIFCHGDFDIGGGAGVSAKEGFDVVFDVAGGGDLLEIAHDFGDAAGEELEGEVDIVSAGVVEQTAAEFGEGLPVVAAGETGGVVAYVEDAAEHA